jgi:hypothetical protein
MNLTEGGSPRKRQATLRFFDTLKSEHGDGFRPSVVTKPMRGGFVILRKHGAKAAVGKPSKRRTPREDRPADPG